MNLILKIIVIPAVIMIVDLLFDNVNFTALYQPIVIGFILSVIGHIMEKYMLSDQTFWLSLGADFIAATILTYVIGLIMPGAALTIYGAAIVGMFLGLTEYFVHQWLINTGRANHSPV